MKEISVKQVLALPSAGERVGVSGWVRTRREAREFCFVEINDGSCLAGLQVIADASLPNYASEVVKLTTGSSVTVEGEVVESPGEGQAYELRASGVRVHQIAPGDYPLQKKRHSFEFLREIAHLRPRTNSLGAVARVRSSLSYAVHTFFNERGFQYVHTPIITASDCEGAGEMFRVTALDLENLPRGPDGKVDFTRDFFGRKASLTVSGQLEGEIYALALGKIYTFGPTFRAENSNTPRHLAEFWMVEPEMAFCDLVGDMDLAEEFVRYLAGWTLDRDCEDLDLFNQRVDTTVIATLENIRDSSFERISYTDAVAILEKSNDTFEYKMEWGADIQTEHERHLAETVFGKPVIVYDYPKDIKAFYRHDVLVERIRSMGLDEKDYWWYLQLRRFGGVPHAGFGLGFERLLLLVTGMKNIRDVIPFPRYPGNAEF